MSNWFALQTRSNVEASVQELLNISGFEDFCPRYQVQSLNKDRHLNRPKTLNRVLFPGYVFTRFDLASKEQHHRVLQVPGVIRLVGYGMDPVVIAEREIEDIRRVAESPFPVQPEPYFAVNEGDRVRVVRGPLAGVEGVVMYAKARPRLVVAIDMMRQAASVEVDADWLELIEKKAA